MEALPVPSKFEESEDPCSSEYCNGLSIELLVLSDKEEWDEDVYYAHQDNDDIEDVESGLSQIALESDSCHINPHLNEIDKGEVHVEELHVYDALSIFRVMVHR